MSKPILICPHCGDKVESYTIVGKDGFTATVSGSTGGVSYASPMQEITEIKPVEPRIYQQPTE